ncbi:hypothetical protein BACCELL_05039 [Bacteroides cellulosilyticus DSM 14838]|uniref:Uncharacterized protein n=1 Tax=Bacteroides cellulosilyticus DSM 14838 TaxID=537012 RepID=E2NL45_9BACE|nr:hypothetical protein BACCELL_05039 [Bacteroides cellulosilyticus DSM 14838]
MIELRFDAEVPADVESAGEVIECDGADAGHEDALKHTFKLLEHLAVEAAGVSEGVVDLIAKFVEHHVGEVVVLVNDEIQTSTVLLGQSSQEIELSDKAALLFDILHEAGVVIGFVFPGEHIHLHAAIFVKTFDKRTDAVGGEGKVEMQHLVNALQGRGMTAYPQISEPCLELRLLSDIVVGPQHAQEDTFAEAPGTDEEQTHRLFFEQGQVHGLVYVILVLLHY